MVVDLVLARERDEVRAVVRQDPSTNTVSIVATVPRYRYEPAVRRAFTTHLLDLLTSDAGEPEVDVDVSLAQDHEVLVRFAVHLPPWCRSTSRPPTSSAPSCTASRGRGPTPRLPRSRRRSVRPPRTGWWRRSSAGCRSPTRRSARPTRPSTTSSPSTTQEHDLDLRIVMEEDGDGRVRALVRQRRLVLSEFLPLLEDLGLQVLDERPHDLEERPGVPDLHLHDFGVRGLPEGLSVPDQVRVADTLRACWGERTSSDSLHRLVISAGLTWQEVSVLRTYRRYRRQVGTAYTPAYVNDALAGNPDVAKAIIDYFHDRFDPERDAPRDVVAASRQTALAACDRVVRLDHDRILRDLVALVGATLRTNLYAESDLPVVVLKLDPSNVPGVPGTAAVPGAVRPRPRRRGDPPARRTGRAGRPALVRPPGRRPHRGARPDEGTGAEELGDRAHGRQGRLRAATATGGPRPRCAARSAASTRCSSRHCSASPTTSTAEDVVPPAGVRRWDGDDPYLVVAADKGTATFSDVANAIAMRRGFWLGDAFASGGSQGLRPQGAGHHRARRLGRGASPPAGTRHPSRAGAGVGGRCRRHVGRRLRQRDAVLGDDPAARRVRPP